MIDPGDKTTTTYDSHAHAYARLNDSVDVIHPLLDRFQAMVPAGRLLDVGCGHGRDAVYFTGRGYTVSGVDRSRGLLALAQRNAPGAAFALADMRQMPYPASAFAGLWVCASLLHIPRMQVPDALAEFRRVLAPGGGLYVGVKHGSGERWISTPVYSGAERFFTFFAPGEIEDLIAAAGFSVTSVTTDDTWINVFARGQG